MINILIIDKNIQYSVKFLNSISTNANIKIIGIIPDIANLNTFKNMLNVEVVLLNVNFLKTFQHNVFFKEFISKHKKLIILLSEKSTFTKNSYKFPIIYKNNFDNLLNLIFNHYLKLPNSQYIKNKINYELTYLGYKSNHIGTFYLAEIIFIIYFTNFEGSLEKSVYPYIAQIYNKKSNSIKCNIINATNLMTLECPESKLSEYLGTHNMERLGPKTIIYAVINKISNKTLNN